MQVRVCERKVQQTCFAVRTNKAKYLGNINPQDIMDNANKK